MALPGLFFSAIFALAMVGCGSAGSLHLGAISVTDLSGTTQGQLTAVSINAKAAITVAVTGDAKNLGVNWTATCGGSPVTPPLANPCGTIAPAYVGNSISMIYTAPFYAPVGNTVTITAAATSDPAISSSVTLTIAPLAIAVALTTPPPSMMAAGGTAVLSATVTNDSLAQGVNWKVTCGSTDCGSLQSGLPIATQTASGGQIVYTAPSTIPSGGTVTITATSVADPSKSVSAVTTIAPISVSIAPSPVTVPLGTTANLIATVAFDSANRGVDWGTPTCGSPGACGSLSVNHTASGAATVYTPPAAIPTGTTVTLTAKATSNPAASATVVITIAPPPPVSITVSPTAAGAQVSGSATIVATVLHDPANLGVNWTLTCGSAGACGSITAHTQSGAAAIYNAPPSLPAGGAVTVSATSAADSTKSATASVTILPAISIAFTPGLPAAITAGTPVSFTATVTNDVAGAGVDWTVSCSNTPCGTFASGNSGAPSHTSSGAAITFTAPLTAPAGTVTITATSTASILALPVRAVSATISVTPVIAVTFVPFAPSQMQVSDNTLVTPPPVALVAAVSNDTTNAGVDWSVCSSFAACGEFQVTPAVAATATTPPINAIYAATVHTSSGQAALFVPPPTPPSPSGTLTITARAHNPAAASAAATATASVKIVTTPTGVPLQGTVMAGTHPVSGSAVYLYAAATTGYSSAASPLTISGSSTSVPTDANGQFSIPAGYVCPSQKSEMYLVAVGGNAGGGANPNLAMMTALGSCVGLSSTASIFIDEVTTIGSVWALAPFMSDYGHVGSSSTNATTGLANAFAAADNLMSPTTGLALATTPAGNATAPRAEINTLANILNTCTSTSGGTVGDGSKCGSLFNATNPGQITASAPINTLQAALNIAQTPSFNTTPGPGSIFSLQPATGPYAPVLTSDPNDWTISLNFTGGGLNARSAATALAFDAQGNAWITNSRFSSVTELNNQGAALSPTGTGTTQATAGGYQGAGLSFPTAIALDPAGNAWVANGGSLSELPFTTPYTYNGTLSGSGYTGGGLSSSVKGLAIDGATNVWAVNGGSPGSVSWFAGTNTVINGTNTVPGTPLSPSSGYTQGINTPSGAIGVDTAGTVWVLNSGNDSAAELNSTNGAFLQSDYGYQQVIPYPINSALSSGVGNTLTIDNAGDVFLSPGQQLVELYAGGSVATDGGLGSATPGTGDNYSQFLAMDGAAHFWLLITGGSNICASPYSVVELDSSGSQKNVNATGCGYLGTGVGGTDVSISVDNSGNLWVLGSGSVTEFVGVAAPVVTPFSLGVQNKTLGRKP